MKSIRDEAIEMENNKWVFSLFKYFIINKTIKVLYICKQIKKGKQLIITEL